MPGVVPVGARPALPLPCGLRTIGLVFHEEKLGLVSSHSMDRQPGGVSGLSGVTMDGQAEALPGEKGFAQDGRAWATSGRECRALSS